MDCNFCGNKIRFSENSLTFKDGAMCQDCTVKYGLVTEKGDFTVDLLNYCQTHTVEEFKQTHKIVPAEEEPNEQKSAPGNVIHCSFCEKEISENEETLDFKDGIMCSSCLTTYGLLRNNQVSPKAITYGLDHTVKQFKDKFKSIGIEDLVIHGDESVQREDNYHVGINNAILEKTKGHTTVERRFIAGILQVALGILTLLATGSIYTVASEYPRFMGSAMLSLLFTIFTLYDGIYMIKTRQEWPKKSTEITNLVILLVLEFFINTSFDYAVMPAYSLYMWALVILYAIGAPFKHDTLAYRVKAREMGLDKAQKEEKVEVVQSTQPTSPAGSSLDEKAEQIAKYKKLLDDDAISQAEYDKIKKDILSDK